MERTRQIRIEVDGVVVYDAPYAAENYWDRDSSDRERALAAVEQAAGAEAARLSSARYALKRAAKQAAHALTDLDRAILAALAARSYSSIDRLARSVADHIAGMDSECSADWATRHAAGKKLRSPVYTRVKKLVDAGFIDRERGYIRRIKEEGPE